MHLCDFEYHRPKTIHEASQLLSTLGEEAFFLAGGTEIVPDLKAERHSANHLVSLRDIPELRMIRDDGDFLRIGAMNRLEELIRSSAVRKAFPVLAEAASTMAGPQIRNQATVGGNFCRAVPCADTPPPCIAGSAKVRLGSGDGERVMPAEEFFVGPRQTVLEPGELLLEILIPAQPRRSGASYQRFSHRKGSALAVASVAARLVLHGDDITEARVVLGAVAPVPLLAEDCCRELAGGKASDDLFRRAAAIAAREARPISDIRGTKQFRRELVERLAIRALSEAFRRARG